MRYSPGFLTLALLAGGAQIRNVEDGQRTLEHIQAFEKEMRAGTAKKTSVSAGAAPPNHS